MGNTLNMQAARWAHQTLFLAEPDPGYATKSLPVRALADDFCGASEPSYESCERMVCVTHTRAMIAGLSKMSAAGDLWSELSPRGVWFVRLSPEGVLRPREWSKLPHWYGTRPEAIDWAERMLQRQREKLGMSGRLDG